MLQAPHDIGERFEAAMQSAPVAEDLRPHFRRWLRFYLDFGAKYGFDPTTGSSFRQFNTKLQDKGQEEWKRRQAHEAVVHSLGHRFAHIKRRNLNYETREIHEHVPCAHERVLYFAYFAYFVVSFRPR